MTDTALAYEDQTDEPTVVGGYILNLLEANQDELGIEALFYGDQSLIPKYPTVCVEAGPMHSQFAGAPFILQNDFTVYMMVYHGKLQDVQLTRKECDNLAYAIRRILLTDKQLGGLVINGFPTDIEPGYAQRSNVLLRTSRITWSGISKVIS